MSDSNNRVIVDGVEYTRLFSFPKILTAVTASLQPARLVIGLLMVVALITFGRIWDGVAEPTDYPLGRSLDIPTQLQVRDPHGPFAETAHRTATHIELTIQGVIGLNIPMVIDSLNGLIIRTPVALWESQKWFTIVFGLFFLIVLAIGGGAISRMSACQIASEERLRIREAFDFSFAAFFRLVIAQALPLLIALGLCLVIMVGGLLFAVPVLDVIASLLYGIALLIGFLIAFLIVGYVLGFLMLIPAVACENCDAADAMQRTYAYVVSRPLHLLAYWAVALLGLALGFILVSLVSTVTLDGTAALAKAFNNNPGLDHAGGTEIFRLFNESPREVDGAWHNAWTGSIITFWQTVVICLVSAYVLTFLFSSSTIVYLLMRRSCDGQDIDEIWREAPPAAAPVESDAEESGKADE